jgi:hypothetical protein
LSIPPFNANGLLPPGEYHATLVEIFAAFPAKTAVRQQLNDALGACYQALQALRATTADPFAVYIDGSYTSRVTDPVDIDILVLTAAYDEDQVRDFVNQSCPIGSGKMAG